jgi:hypothetical protein
MATVEQRLKVCRRKTGEYRLIIKQYQENCFIKLLRKLRLLQHIQVLHDKPNQV